MSKQRDQLALEIFLKRLPTMPLTESSRRHYESTVDLAYEVADLFLSQAAVHQTLQAARAACDEGAE
jgi:hypothetical protein